MDQSKSIAKQIFFTVSDKTSGSKHVCYTHDYLGDLNLGLTDGEDVWRTKIDDETKAQLLKQYSSKTIEDCLLRLKSSCSKGNASVTVELDEVVLHLGSSPRNLPINLSKLSEADRKTELKELLFRMADRLSHWQSTEGHQISYSPAKNTPKKNNEFVPRKHQSGNGLATGARKRLPGDSLINPGAKSKRPATGVAFDDDDGDEV